jgi:hypothetical protein
MGDKEPTPKPDPPLPNDNENRIDKRVERDDRETRGVPGPSHQPSTSGSQPGWQPAPSNQQRKLTPQERREGGKGGGKGP